MWCPCNPAHLFSKAYIMKFNSIFKNVLRQWAKDWNQKLSFKFFKISEPTITDPDKTIAKLAYFQV